MIFVDTGAWIALTDKNDKYHEDAIRIYTFLKQQKKHLLTTDYVLDETVTRLRYDSSHDIATRFLDVVTLTSKTDILQIVYTEHNIFYDATVIFRKYETAVLSFTDCVSFAVCKKYEIHKAFGFDSHFPMMGISLIM